MPKKKTVKQTDKVYTYIRRTGFWNQGIGFVFLVLAAFCAYGLSRGGPAALFFLPIVGGLTEFILFLWVSVGLTYIVSGYYLHQKSGRFTKPALWVTAVLSLVTIKNIIPAIPLIFSVYALIKLRKVVINDVKGRDYRIRFNPREFPAFTIALVLVFFTFVWVVQGEL